jgi:hypothetical protein
MLEWTEKCHSDGQHIDKLSCKWHNAVHLLDDIASSADSSGIQKVTDALYVVCQGSEQYLH